MSTVRRGSIRLARVVCVAAFALLGLLAPHRARAGCVADARALAESSKAALELYARLDTAAFLLRAREIEEGVRCLADVPASMVARDLHVVMALQASLERDQEAAVRAFRAAIEIDPSYEPTESVAAPGSPARVAFEMARARGDWAWRALRRGDWVVDGLPADRLPTTRSSLVQQLGSSGVASTWYLSGAEGGAALQALPSPVRASIASPRRGLAVAASITGGLALASLGASAAVWSIEDPPDSSIDRLTRINHGTVISGAGLGVVAAGLGVAALVVER